MVTATPCGLRKRYCLPPPRTKFLTDSWPRETGLEITCCHFPPGTSKWNKIEHRLFSRITMNWRGRPLASHEVIVNSIAATTTAAAERQRVKHVILVPHRGGRIRVRAIHDVAPATPTCPVHSTSDHTPDHTLHASRNLPANSSGSRSA